MAKVQKSEALECRAVEEVISPHAIEGLVYRAEVLSQEDANYKNLIIEKLKSAAEWDDRDTKKFALR